MTNEEMTKEEIIQTLTDKLNRIDKVAEKIANELQKINDHYEGRIQELMKQRDAVKKQYCDATKRDEFTAKRDRVNSFLGKLIDDAETLTADLIPQLTKKYEVMKTPIELPEVEFIPIGGSLPALGSVVTNETPDPDKSEIDYPSQFSLGKTNEFAIKLKDSDGYFCKGGIDISAKLTSSTNEEPLKIGDNSNGSCVVSFRFPPTWHAGKAELSVVIGGRKIKRSIIVNTNDYQNFKCSNISLNAFGKLLDIAFSRYGKRWALADEDNHCVYLYFDSNKLIIKHDNLQKPTSIAFDDNNDLYVMAGALRVPHSDYIYRFNTNGKFFCSFGKCGSGVGELGHPSHGIAVHNGKVYVADCTNNRIVVFRNDGLYETTINLYGPIDVAVNLKGNALHVIDSYKHVVTYTLGGHCELGNFDTKNRNSEPVCPQKLAIDADGLILVKSGSSVHIFDCVGNYISCFDFTCNAYGIAVSPYGQVCTSGDNSIQVWELAA
ncbi:E3 ubiquitin-protein ligase TRIM71-like [Dysidea avara]|uniref:E3 ubiquitin-protein ligase TRIM71-like n=1 Tax=Dysidea avara TaxID=196820 RepID=UPI0033282B32